jgi:TPR repeat protein
VVRQAAEHGVATAQLRLGFLYLSGEGVVPDPEAGVAWLRRAVEVGNPEAQTALGMLYA